MLSVKFNTFNEALIKAVNDFIDEWNATEPYVRVMTSGSTGKPSEISLLKTHMRASADNTINYLGLQRKAKAVLCLSPTTIAGKMMIVRAIMADMELTVVDVDRNPLKEIEEEYDFAAMIPIQVEESIERSLTQFKKIKKIIIGGAPISPTLYKRISQEHGGCYQTFGMTETISHIAMRKIASEETPYEALPGISFTSENDCLVIHAPQIGIDSMSTNDTVELLDETHFNWKGRSDFTINSGGIKIHPEEIEPLLSKIIQSPFFVSGIPDPSLGYKLILCIEGRQTISKIELKKILPDFSVPKEIYFFDKFHYTASGKVNRPKTIEDLNDVEKQVL